MPTEPNILIPPVAVVAVSDAVKAAVAAKVPPKKVGQNLLIATWNLRAFGNLTKRYEARAGDSPKRNYADIHAIAAIISHFDVIAVQEVRGNIRALRNLLKLLGDDWGFLLTDVTKGPAGNDERLAFLFDSRRVKPSGLACELVVWISQAEDISEGMLDRQFARTPYACSFATVGGTAPTTFILVTLHVDWGDTAKDRLPELRTIADWLANWAEREEDWNHNVIALGDFNIDGLDDDLYAAFTSTGLEPAPGLADLPRTIFDKPTAHHHYDQIAWFTTKTKNRPLLTLNCSAADRFDFVPLLRGQQTLNSLSFRISDHYPMFVEFELPQGT